MNNSVYISPEKRDVFRTVYNGFLAGMPFAKRVIDTPYGETFLLEAGDPANPAVVLLHGSCSNSAFWFNDIMALKDNYHVFAADIPGEAGNSSEYRLSLDSSDYADWMAAVLDALNLPRASIAGNSLGGWMALKFATTYPARVEKLMLFASGGLAPIRADFLERAQAAEEADETLTMEEDVAGGDALPKEILDFINLILESYRPLSIPMPLFSREQLKQLTMPVLYVAGLADDLLDSPAGEAALRAGVPHAEIHMLPDAGHLITTPFVWMLPFLAQ
jgi:pimeloyl-ACP methyl ester carboxylesterase